MDDVAKETKVLYYPHRSYDYISPRKNPWIYGFTCKSAAVDMCTTHSVALIYRNDGFTAIHYSLEEKSFNYYTAHFFKRYNERLKLHLVNPRDKIRHFIKHCGKGLLKS